MNKWLTILLILIFLIACKEKNNSTPILSDQVSISNQLIGTWKLVYAEIQENDSVTIKDVTKSEFIKIINHTHFAFFNQNHTESEGFYGGAGSYTLNGDDYVEVLDFIKTETLRGHTFPFRIKFEGDTLIQYGTEEVKNANLKRFIIEKYIKIEDLK